MSNLLKGSGLLSVFGYYDYNCHDPSYEHFVMNMYFGFLWVHIPKWGLLGRRVGIYFTFVRNSQSIFSVAVLFHTWIGNF